MMMLTIPVIKGITADTKSQYDHPGFKENIVDNIDTKQWQAGQK